MKPITSVCENLLLKERDVCFLNSKGAHVLQSQKTCRVSKRYSEKDWDRLCALQSAYTVANEGLHHTALLAERIMSVGAFRWNGSRYVPSLEAGSTWTARGARKSYHDETSIASQLLQYSGISWYRLIGHVCVLFPLGLPATKGHGFAGRVSYVKTLWKHMAKRKIDKCNWSF